MLFFDIEISTFLYFCKFLITRKYPHPLCGYFQAVLMNTTALDRLWGGDVFIRLYIRSSALPRVVAVGLGCWNC